MRWPQAGCTTSSAAASTGTRSTSAGSCRTSRRCCTTTRSSPTCYLHGWQATGKTRYRVIVEQTIRYLLRELSLDGGGFASSQDADTDGKEGLTFTWTRKDGIPDEMLYSFEGGRFIIRGELDETKRRQLFEVRDQRPKPARDDKAVASWNGLALAALAECGRVLGNADWVEAARSLGEFLLGPLSDRGRTSSPHVARRGREGPGLPRGLRRRRERPARASRRDRRVAVAPGGEPARPARGRALRRRGERRVLPEPRRRRAADRPEEDLRRPAGAERQLDARIRPAAPVADLRRRRARGEGALGLQADPRRAPERPLVVRVGARRGRPLSLATARDRDRRAGPTARSRRRRFAASSRTP